MESAIGLTVILAWAIFILYWAGSLLYDLVTRRFKPVEKSTGSSASWLVRIALAAIVVFLIGNGRVGIFIIQVIPYSLALSIAGVIILACGVGFAVWARIHLGSNWSGTIVLKKGQTLTKTGPYSIVRHPIYTGLLFGGIGTFLAIGNMETLLFAIGMVLFTLNRVRVEEKLMLGRFGKQFAQYQKETKKIVPLLY